ncbi:queuosine salvage protein-like protein, partial [Tanacetum coccineum]
MSEYKPLKYGVGFRDHTVYKGHQVFLYKREQIFAADVWGAFKGQGFGEFSDVGSITIFAYYIILLPNTYKVDRVWKQNVYGKPLGIENMQCIFIDKEGSRIHASVKSQFLNIFERLLSEGSAMYLSSFEKQDVIDAAIVGTLVDHKE